MVKVYNPTGWRIEARAAGEEYNVEPFGELEIYDLYHAAHVVQSFKKVGLVSLEWGPKAQEKYDNDYTKYKTDQEIAGLKEVLKTKERALSDEIQAEKDIAQKGGGQGYKDMLNKQRFEKEIKLVKSWIRDAGGTIEKKEEAFPVVEKRPEWRSGGKGKVDGESRPAKN